MPIGSRGLMLKKSEEFLGLPIISITEGQEFGRSKSLLIDAGEGTVAAIIIEDSDWYHGIKLLPYSSVIAIGTDAITITKSDDILTIDEASEYEEYLEQNIKIIGTRAITKSGTLQGRISDIFINESGHIEKIALTNDADTKEVSTSNVSIFGKEVTIIDNDGPKAMAAPQATPAPAAPAPTPAVAPKPAPAPALAPAAAAKPEIKPEAKKEAAPPEMPAPQAAPAPAAPKVEADKPEVKAPEKAAAAPEEKAAKVPEAPAPSVTASSAENRHRQFLLGKKATRRITTDTGIVIVDEGGDVTEEVLQKAKLANKFVELSMNVK